MMALRVKMMAWRVNEKLNLKWFYFLKNKEIISFFKKKKLCVLNYFKKIYLVKIDYQDCTYK